MPGRQLPLFPNMPASPDDISIHTALKHTISVFQMHLQQDGKTEHTLKAFTSDLHLLADYSGDDTTIGEYTTEHLARFLSWLESGRGVPCSRKSYARRVTTLKVYFKWLFTIGAIPHDPALAILQRSGQAPLSEIIEDEELSALLAYTYTLRIGERPDARPEMLLRLISETGIKKAEAERLTPADIIRMGKDHAVMVIKHASPKDVYKERRIDLSGKWLEVYEEYIQQYRPQTTLFTCTTRNLEYILADIAVGAGIEKKPSFEMLRWTCALQDYRAGMEPDAIREKMGLSKISWVETFAKIKRLAGEGNDEDD
jgi:site-specific recombinase XerD